METVGSSGTVRAILVSVFGGYADCLRALPYIRATRQGFPGASVALLTQSWGREMFGGCPYVDEIIVGRAAHLSQRPLGGIRRLVSLVPYIRGRFDLFIGSPYHHRFAALCALACGARWRAGYRVAGLPLAWTHAVGPAPPGSSLEARLDKLWQAIGLTVTDPTLEVYPTDEDRAHVQAFLESSGIGPGDVVVGIHPGSDWGCQQWHPLSWSHLCAGLQERYGATVVMTGTMADQHTFQEIARRLVKRSISAIGQTTLGQLAALVARFHVLVCVDSLLVPLGLATGIPVIALCMRHPSPWSESRWPNLETVHPPRWFQSRFPNEICRVSKQRRGIRSCHDPGCIGSQGAALITAQSVLQLAGRHLAKAPGPVLAVTGPARYDDSEGGLA